MNVGNGLKLVNGAFCNTTRIAAPRLAPRLGGEISGSAGRMGPNPTLRPRCDKAWLESCREACVQSTLHDNALGNAGWVTG